MLPLPRLLCVGTYLLPPPDPPKAPDLRLLPGLVDDLPRLPEALLPVDWREVEPTPTDIDLLPRLLCFLADEPD